MEKNISIGLSLARTLRPFLTTGPLKGRDADATIRDISKMIDNQIEPYKNIVEALSKIGIYSPHGDYPINKVNALVSKASDLIAKP